MKIVDVYFVTDSERAMRDVLEAHPDLLCHVTRLLNGYRELLGMAVQGGDMADIVRSAAKKDMAVARLGIVLEKIDGGRL